MSVVLAVDVDALPGGARSGLNGRCMVEVVKPALRWPPGALGIQASCRISTRMHDPPPVGDDWPLQHPCPRGRNAVLTHAILSRWTCSLGQIWLLNLQELQCHGGGKEVAEEV